MCYSFKYRLLKKIRNAEVVTEIQNEAKFEEAQIHWVSGNSETAKLVFYSTDYTMFNEVYNRM